MVKTFVIVHLTTELSNVPTYGIGHTRKASSVLVHNGLNCSNCIGERLRNGAYKQCKNQIGSWEETSFDLRSNVVGRLLVNLLADSKLT